MSDHDTIAPYIAYNHRTGRCTDGDHVVVPIATLPLKIASFTIKHYRARGNPLPDFWGNFVTERLTLVNCVIDLDHEGLPQREFGTLILDDTSLMGSFIKDLRHVRYLYIRGSCTVDNQARYELRLVGVTVSLENEGQMHMVPVNAERVLFLTGGLSLDALETFLMGFPNVSQVSVNAVGWGEAEVARFRELIDETHISEYQIHHMEGASPEVRRMVTTVLREVTDARWERTHGTKRVRGRRA